MPAGQQIAFEPALTLVLAQHLHHPAVGSKVIVIGLGLGDPSAVRHLEHVLPAVGIVLIRAKQAKVAEFEIELHHIAQILAHDTRRFRGRGAGRGNLDCIVAEIRQPEVAQEGAAVGVRIGAHPSIA